MKKWIWLVVLALLFSTISTPKTLANTSATVTCAYTSGTYWTSFTTPKTLPDGINMYYATTWFYIEATYFNSGSPGVYVELLDNAGARIGPKALLTSAHPTFIWDPYPWLGCVYVKLTTAGSGPASGGLKIMF